MTRYANKYTIELRTKTGSLLADISRLARKRQIIESRNKAETFTFELDLDDFEQYCTTLGIDPKNVLIVNSVEIWVKRLGTYMFSTQLNYRNTTIRSEGNTVYCSAFGWLAQFGKRYTGQTDAGSVSDVYSTADGTADLSRTDLAWALIDQSQQLTNGDFGITRGTPGGSSTLYQKNYRRSNIAEALYDMTGYQAGPIDMWFTYDKQFMTATQRGSIRPEIVFEYPGNILEMDIPEDGTDMANEVIALGAGAADGTQTTVIKADTSSQASYQLRQEVVQSNGTNDEDGGVTNDATTALAKKHTPFNIPSFVVNGNVAPYVTDYGIGDFVTVKVNNHPLHSEINRLYRVERRTIDIDDDGNETVTLEVSDR